MDEANDRQGSGLVREEPGASAIDEAAARAYVVDVEVMLVAVGTSGHEHVIHNRHCTRCSYYMNDSVER